MHVVQASFFQDPSGRRPQELLHVWPSLVDVAEAATCAGARVTVMQASQYTETLDQGNVVYQFLPAGDVAFDLRLRELSPDVLHVHGFDFPRDVLRAAAISPKSVVALQDHACRPPRLWRRGLHRRGFAAADGVAFCAPEQAQPFMDAGLFQPTLRVYEVPESTSRFSPGDQQEARRATGTAGSPLVLFVGNLIARKDPLTVMAGVRQAAVSLPDLQLWCCFGSAPLLPDVERLIATDPVLRDRVHLLGRVPHATIEQLMRAADVFVLGSHAEGSGYALIEALACGLPPVVTDIPSFRVLTGQGEIGALWPRGDARALADSLVAVAARCSVQERDRVRAHFDNVVGQRAVGRKLSAMYEDLLQHRHKPQGCL